MKCPPFENFFLLPRIRSRKIRRRGAPHECARGMRGGGEGRFHAFKFATERGFHGGLGARNRSFATPLSAPMGKGMAMRKFGCLVALMSSFIFITGDAEAGRRRCCCEMEMACMPVTCQPQTYTQAACCTPTPTCCTSTPACAAPTGCSTVCAVATEAPGSATVTPASAVQPAVSAAPPAVEDVPASPSTTPPRRDGFQLDAF